MTLRTCLLFALCVLLAWNAPASAAESVRPATAQQGESKAATPLASSLPLPATAQKEYRPVSFEKLTAQVLGVTSRAVRFDWRRKRVAVGVLGGPLFELNNFATTRLGSFVRLPTKYLLFEGSLSYLFVQGSPSTLDLAMTPYRQTGRPSRIEMDLLASYPLVEGVGTVRLLPSTEFVLSLTGGVRSLFYPVSLQEFFRFNPVLSKENLTALEPWRLPGMKIDPSRYSLLLGLSMDLYAPAGFLISPRVLWGAPLGSDLDLLWDCTLAVGWMF